MPNWQIRIVLPTLVRVARASQASNPQLDVIIAELTGIAHMRGLESTLAELRQIDEAYAIRAQNGNGPAVADPSRAVTPDEV